MIAQQKCPYPKNMRKGLELETFKNKRIGFINYGGFKRGKIDLGGRF